MAFFPDLSQPFADLVDGLRGQRVAVLGHARPDGDCIGSQIALTRMLQAAGCEAQAFNADRVPEALRFLIDDFRIKKLDAVAMQDDLPLIFVDCADQNRVGNAESKLIVDKAYLANIDHHISNTEYGELNLVDATAAATCEILAGIAFDLGWDLIPATAQALLTGIMTDTGRYSYPATSQRVFEISGRLVECGARPHVTAQSLYENEPFSRLLLLQRFLNTLQIECDGRLGWGMLTRQDFIDTDGVPEQTEGFVDYTRSIRGVKVGLYLEERHTTVKASLRAESPEYRVDQIAKHFGGGGHASAAAFSTDEALDSVRDAVIAKIGERLLEIEGV